MYDKAIAAALKPMSEIIKSERKEQGLSRRDLADKAKVTERAIAYWENGQREISISCAQRICRALKIVYVLG